VQAKTFYYHVLEY